MSDILQKLQSATEGSRDLDCEIAWLTGWDAPGSVGQMWRDNYPSLKVRGPVSRSANNYGVPHFSTNLQDAVSLVSEGHFWAINSGPNGPYVSIWSEDGPRHWGDSQTAPLAFCIAIIKAHESKEAEAA